jgi:ADP-ribose pyrophosphatase YjhB (NUDIX family)
MRQPYLVERSPGYLEYQLPVSLKAVVTWRGRVPLLRNERNEWELPGGKLEVGEDPRDCLRREIAEELSWDVTVAEQPFHLWVYKIRPDRHVLVVSYLASYDGDVEPRLSHEHKELGMFGPAEVPALRMPEAYKEAIAIATEPGRGGRYHGS